MRAARSLAILILVAAARLLMVTATAQAFDFENVCPTQAPPGWAASAWTHFRESCISNGVDRAVDRNLWESCINTCVSANHAEGRVIQPKRAQGEKGSTASAKTANPNWCAGVPASTPPLNKISPEEWASVRQRCMNETNADVVCLETCEGARELWKRAKEGPPREAPKYPLSTDKLQGPFPLQGGAKGWVLPLPSGLQTPAITGTPAGSGASARSE